MEPSLTLPEIIEMSVTNGSGYHDSNPISLRKYCHSEARWPTEEDIHDTEEGLQFHLARASSGKELLSKIKYKDQIRGIISGPNNSKLYVFEAPLVELFNRSRQYLRLAKKAARKEYKRQGGLLREVIDQVTDGMYSVIDIAKFR